MCSSGYNFWSVMWTIIIVILVIIFVVVLLALLFAVARRAMGYARNRGGSDM